MDFTLVTVTVLALAIALTMTLLTWRLIREERRRSAARIAALAAELGSEGARPDIDGLPRAVVAAAADVRGRERGSEDLARPKPSPAPQIAVRVRRADPAADAQIRPSTPLRATPAAPSAVGQVLFAADDAVETPEDLFAIAQRPSRGHWKLAIACLALVGLVGSGAVFVLKGTPSANRAAGVSAPGAPPALELMSLRHTRQGGTLTITGLVRNPVAGHAVQRLTAVAFLFDRNGSFVASGRAPLDFTTLAPGDESPFVIAVEAPAGVSRYRVSFRTEAGAVMPHADRREREAVTAVPDSASVRLKS